MGEVERRHLRRLTTNIWVFVGARNLRKAMVLRRRAGDGACRTDRRCIGRRYVSRWRTGGRRRRWYHRDRRT
jgi:hypothetical protein